MVVLQKIIYGCGDYTEWDENHRNSDARCHRKYGAYSLRVLRRDNSICDNCVYRIWK